MKRHIDSTDSADAPTKKKAKLDTDDAIYTDDTIIELPSELVEEIASFIDNHRCRRNLRVVSKKWFRILHDTTFTFSRVLSSDIGELVALFARSKNLLGLRLLKTNFRTYQHEDVQQLAKLTQLTSFVGHFQASRELNGAFLSSLTNLEDLDVTCLKADNLNKLTKLSKLKIAAFTLPTARITLPNLEELTCGRSEVSLFGPSHNVKHLTVLSNDPIQQLYFTALESLQIEGTCGVLPVTLTRLEAVNQHADQTICSLTNLKHLAIGSIDGISLSGFANLEVLKVDGFPKNIAAVVEQLSLLPGLRELHIGLQDKADKCVKLIGAMTTLRALSLNVEGIVNPTSLGALTNLKSLTYDNQFRTLSFDWLKQLTQLAELVLSVHVTRSSVNLASLNNLTRLVLHQVGISSPHSLAPFTKLLELKLQFRTNDPSQMFVGLSALTTLTRLDAVFQTDDAAWRDITQLTDLQLLSELEYVGNRETRLWDLTVMQKLTCFVTQMPLNNEDVLTNFTALTTLQHITCSDYNTRSTLRKYLPYLELQPRRWDQIYS